MLLKVVPVTVIVVALGLSAARRACASVLVVPPIPGMLTTVVFEPRRDERRTEAGKQRHTARRFGVRHHALRSYCSWIATRRG